MAFINKHIYMFKSNPFAFVFFDTYTTVFSLERYL